MIIRRKRALPTLDEMFIGRDTAGNIFANISDRINTMGLYTGLRRVNVILRPYSQTWRPDMDLVDDAQTRYIPFTATRAGWLIVSLGYQATDNNGVVTVSTREPPAVVMGAATPASGAVIDPGCQWLAASGDIPSVRQGRSFTEWGLGWVDNGYVPGEDPDPADPVSAKPRLIYVSEDNLEIEIAVTWQHVFLNTVSIQELFDASN